MADSSARKQMQRAQKSFEVRFPTDHVERFARATGDVSPLHMSSAHARRTSFGSRIAHGVLGALAALGHIEAPVGLRLAGIEIRFLGPVFLEQAYQIVVEEASAEEVAAAIVDGARPCLSIRARYEPGAQGALEGRADEGARPASRGEAADLAIEAIRKGQVIEGTYAPRWAELDALLEDLHARRGGVGLREAAVLAWSSYLIGMELPGRRALFSRLEVDFGGPAPSGAAPLRCRAEVDTVDAELGLVGLRAEAAAASGPAARLRLFALVRRELAGPSAAEIGSMLDRPGALAGKVALVLGGSRGLGAAIVQALAHAGCSVYLSYLAGAEEAARVRASLGDLGASVHLVQGDAGDPAWCDATRGEILARHGRIDLLVCNACLPLQPLPIDPATTARVADYVGRSVALVHVPLSRFLNDLGRSGGWAVAISSSAAREPVADWPHYVSAKLAIEGLVRTAAVAQPEAGFLLVRPPRLLTDLTNVPGPARPALPPEPVAVEIVKRLLGDRPAGEVALLEDFTAAPAARSSGGAPSASAGGGGAGAPAARRLLAIAATFVAEPIQDAIELWSDLLGFDLEIAFAPYNQVFQELLAPSSLLHQNRDGLNVVLLRFEDWLRDTADGEERLDDPARLDLGLSTRRIEQNLRDLGGAVVAHKQRCGAALLVCLCPPSPVILRSRAHALLLREAAERLRAALEGIPGVHVIEAEHEAHRYPVEQVYDPTRDQMGHIPYRPIYFAVLGTIVARTLHALLRPPFKVLVLDCDNTLWKGVCGEDGPNGVEIGPSFRYLQARAAEQSERGMLVCLASKNVEQDVLQVFDARKDMPLRLEHIAARRINWHEKSENLRALAAELNLGLDSFVFIDDNPVEIAEVQAACPEVLALALPRAEEVPAFLDHLWALDRLRVTEEDQKRSLTYRQEQERRSFQTASLSFDDFIRGLDLRIEIAEIRPEQLPRAAQLTQRTNQFNFTTLRRSEGEIQALLAGGGHRCWLVRVRDRFGDYGITGMVLARREPDRLSIDTLLLSCRVLGRGVEHATLAHLGRVAREEGLALVEATFVPTPKNQPARRFLEAVAGDLAEARGGATVFRIATDRAAAVVFTAAAPGEGAAPADEGGEARPPRAGVDKAWHAALARVCRELSDVRCIEEEIQRRAARKRAQAGEGVAAPADPIEERAEGEEAGEGLLPAALTLVRDVIAKVLAVPKERIHPDTSFDKLKLSSFAIIEAVVSLEEELGSLPKTLLYEHKTISSLARALLRDHRAQLEQRLAPGRSSAGAPARAPSRAAAPPEARPVPAAATPRPMDVAVIGVAGRYPGAESVREFWKNLRSGQCCTTRIPRERWDHSRVYDPTGSAVNKSYTEWGGFIDQADAFNSLFFNISPREAALMDPQQRIFLEVAYEAVEDAGYTRRALGPGVGVYVGAMANNYQILSAEASLAGHSPYPFAENYQIANRVSYFFDLCGPSVVIDTACSASGVAIHAACKALRDGECDVAIAGGVNLILHPQRYIQYSQMKMLSRDERCRAFGADAQGFVMGEGAGAVILKPLPRALQDGDHIYAVIRGSSVNSGGRTSGFTVPNPAAQAALVREALERAGVEPRSVSYVEAHGTGTPLGDPIEVRGLTEAFGGSAADRQFCAIGSVKPNIGHLEPAAAVAGLTKILMQMEHGELAPSLHAESLNPYIDFESTPFYVQRELGEWRRPRLERGGAAAEAPRRAGLSSFGAGGVNVHLVLEEHRAAEGPIEPAQGAELFVLSAQSEERLMAYAERLRRFLAEGGDGAPGRPLRLGDVAFTLHVGREPMEERLALIAESSGELVDKLDRFLQGEPEIEGVFVGSARSSAWLPEVLGQGEEALSFLRSLLQRRKLDKLARLWIQGAEIPWEELHHGRGRRRVPLPTYPFDRVRHWLPLAEPAGGPRSGESAGVAALHPLLDANESTLDGARFVKRWDGEEFYLRDHVIAGQRMLPGVVYLEMARIAGELARGGGQVQRLAGVVWERPITVSGPPVQASVVLQASQGDVIATVRTGPAGEAELVHARCRLPHGGRGEAPRPPPAQIESIRARCERRVEREEIYRGLAARGFEYGATFQVIEEHLRSEGEALSRLALPAGLEDPRFHLHPSILDGALQTVIAGLQEGVTFVPFALEELTLYERLPPRCYAHARFGPRGGDALRCDVSVLDQEGRILAELRGLTLRALQIKAAAQRAHYYRAGWENAEAPAIARMRPDEALVILDHDAARFEEWIGQLGGQPVDLGRVLLVEPGATFAPPDRSRCRVRPDVEGDHHAWLKTLAGARALTVVDLWSLGPSATGGLPADLDPWADRADRLPIRRMFHLSRALLTQGTAEEVRVISFCRTDEDDPLGAAIGGFARALGRESTRIYHKVVQLEAGGSPTLDQALRERADCDVEVRYGPHGRARRAFQPVEGRDLEGGGVEIRRGGVYVITGGAGGLGALLTSHLASRWGAALVLAGRSELDEARGRALMELAPGAGRVAYVRADVTRREDVERIVAEAHRQFGPIHGVIHAAGVIEDGYLAKKSWASFARVLAPKLAGACLLDEATADEPLDFFLMCSSTASVIGSAGQADYAAANRFLDAFAERREALARAGRRRGRTIAVSWPLWRDGGMRVGRELVELTARTTGMGELSTEAGLQAVEDALRLSAPGLVVTCGDRARIDAALGVTGRMAPSKDAPVPPASSMLSQSRPALSAGPATRAAVAEVLARLQAFLLEKASELLKVPVEDFDAEDDMSEYGFDSIAITTFANSINEAFDLALTPVLFFENASIGAVARFLLAKHREAVFTHLRGGPALAEAAPAEPAPAPPRQSAKEPTQTSSLVPPWAAAAMDAAPETRPTGGPPRVTRIVVAPAANAVEMTAASGPARAPDAVPAGAHPGHIAVIGLAGRFPGSPDLEAFWRRLAASEDLIREVPKERWSWQAYHGDPRTEPNKTLCRWGGFVDDIDAFDALFFHISPREAQLMDPQQRMFLEVSWAALEDAGYDPSSLAGSRTGVFAGVTLHDYLELVTRSGLDVVAHTATGNVHSIVPNRLSYLLDLRGPSEPIDTACSSALVALHRAVTSIHSGDCDLAIVGGVNAILSPTMVISFNNAGMLASDGRCKTFDRRADGYVRGEGAGVVILKPLERALADGDTIRAVLLGSAVNHGGHATSLTAPNPNAQASVIAAACSRAGVPAETISYIEAHGTGTELGDPIEIKGLKEAFAERFEREGVVKPRSGTCGLGTVKTNIGHLESAAGIAGVIKVILAMKHRALPPTLHFRELNPYIDLGGTPFYIVDALRAWEPPPGRDGSPIPRRAGVSSFGFGGVNAHVVLEEPPPAPPRSEGGGPHIIALSAMSEERLAAYARALRGFLAARLEGAEEPLPPLADIAYTLQIGRKAMSFRLAFVARTAEEVVHRLDAYLAGTAAPGAVFTGQSARRGEVVAPDGVDLPALAARWAGGAEIRWRALHDGSPRRRVPLPTYPFARDRHWIRSLAAPEGAAPPAPGVRAAPEPVAAPPLAQAPGEQKLLLVKRWRPAPLGAAPSPGQRTYLLVVNYRGAIDILKDLGAIAGTQWIIVKEAGPLPRITPWEYDLDLSDGRAAEQIVEEILARHPQIDGLLDLSDVHAAPREAPDRDEGKLALLQGLLRSRPGAPLSIVHFTRGLTPFQSARPTLAGARFAGVVRMLGAEYARLRAVSVDVDVGYDQAEQLLEIAVREASEATLGEVCYREGVRYEPHLEALGAGPGTRGDPSALGPFPIDPARVYVITGATGGLGAEVARALVERGARKLALLSARAVPGRAAFDGAPERAADADADAALRIRRVAALEQLGAEVELFCGPLTDRERLGEFLGHVRRRLGPVAGVVHCAGVPARGAPAFIEKDLVAMRQVWEPKVEGLTALHDALAGERPDFFILYSSISAVVPALAVGMSDYASANAFLDAFAAYHGGRGKTRYLALDWPSWGETGMGRVSNPRYTGLGFTAHSTADGLALLEAALAQPAAPCVLPCVADPARLRLDDLLAPRPSAARPGPPPAAAEPAPEDNFEAARALLLDLLSRELMIPRERIAGDATFDAFGVDSIVIAGLVTKMERFTGRPVEPSLILEHPTLDALSRRVGERYGEGIRSYLARHGSAAAPAASPAAGAAPRGAVHLPPPVASAAAPAASADPARRPAEGPGAARPPRIAVVGVACRFPGAPDASAFWQSLTLGRSSIVEVPPSRWDAGSLYSPDYVKGKSISKWGGFIEGIEDFDPGHFGMQEEDAAHVDPLTRLFLECGELVTRDAGYEKADLWGRRIGVFAGSGTSNYGYRIRQPTRSTAAGLNQNFIAAQLAHFFNLRGPTLVIDTACSSSLVAIYLACQSLLAGESEMAIAGGADLLLDEIPYMKLTEARALSPDGRCYTFDAKANGFVPGEGCGAVLLKPLDRAIADGDRIYAVIEGCAVNNDGHTMGLTTPNMQAQEEVILDALGKAGADPSTISYVEAHGTGTMIGDPIELKALTNVFRRSTDEAKFCAIGSVKTNVGHLLLAAGAASFIKVALALHHGIIPPTLHCDEPNPRFSFATSPFFPIREARPWTPRGGVRRAGISAFGFGGTNCHVILRAPEPGLDGDHGAVRRPLPPPVLHKRRCWIDRDRSAAPRSGERERPAPLLVLTQDGPS